MRHKTAACGWAVSLAVLLFAGHAHADQPKIDVDRFVERLRTGSDFKIRTNAAVVLSAVGEDDKDRVVTPLCQALNDSDATVRQFSAFALKRIGRSSAAGCLRSRLGQEQNSDVKLQLQRALDAVDSGGGGGSSGAASNNGLHFDPDAFVPKKIPNAKFYVAISSITNNSGRPLPDIEKTVLPAVRGKIESLGTHQLAPPKESPSVAAPIVKKFKKGFYLSLSVDKFDYSDGNLRVRLKCTVFDYPGKNLRGEVPAGLTQTGVKPGDHAAEDQLLQMAAERAVELFVQNFQ